MEEKYNIGIIVPAELTDVIYMMEGIHKILTVGKKPHGRPSSINLKQWIMYIFRCDHIKNDRLTEELPLSQNYQKIEQVKHTFKITDFYAQ